MPVSAKPGFLSTTEKILLQLKASFALADRQTLNINTNQAPSGLVSLLKSVTSQLQKFSEMMQTQYFSHTKPASDCSDLGIEGARSCGGPMVSTHVSFISVLPSVRAALGVKHMAEGRIKTCPCEYNA